ncbi:MAG: hypothetical protein LBV27_07605 [Oscillospiraceae bacterium]|jgi:hypothetical protein|nr:hypothetical protein [Oscillospiraceae bacterium]
MNTYYKSSGKFNPVGLVAGLLFSTVVVLALHIVCALIGAWLNEWIVEMIITLGVGFGSRFFYKHAVAVGKIRNVAVARIMILVSSVFIFMMHLIYEFGFAVYTNPDMIGEAGLLFYLRNLPYYIQYGFMDIPIIGTVIMALLTEVGIMGIIFFVVVAVACLIIPQSAAKRAKEPFSEEKGKWMKQVYSNGRLLHFIAEEKNTLESALLNGDITPLLRRERSTRYNDAKYGLVAFYKIDGGHTGYIAIYNLEHEHIRKNTYNANNFSYKEFIAPLQIDIDKAVALERNLDSGAPESAQTVDPVSAPAADAAPTTLPKRRIDGPL